MTIKEIGALLKTQDNRITDEPIFVVQQKRRQYGLDTDYAENTAWMFEGEEVDSEEAKELELRYSAGTMSTYDEQHTRIGYVDLWEFVTACFTEAGAQAYIDTNGHNLTEPRIYVESGYRNAEWIAIRKHLSEATESADRDRERDAIELEISSLKLALRAADGMARRIDELIANGSIGSRWTVSDARLDYGQPGVYEWSDRP